MIGEIKYIEKVIPTINKTKRPKFVVKSFWAKIVTLKTGAPTEGILIDGSYIRDARYAEASRAIPAIQKSKANARE